MPLYSFLSLLILALIPQDGFLFDDPSMSNVWGDFATRSYRFIDDFNADGIKDIFLSFGTHGTGCDQFGLFIGNGKGKYSLVATTDTHALMVGFHKDKKYGRIQILSMSKSGLEHFDYERIEVIGTKASIIEKFSVDYIDGELPKEEQERESEFLKRMNYEITREIMDSRMDLPLDAPFVWRKDVN